MGRIAASFVLVAALASTAPPVAAETVSGPAEVAELAADATTLTVSLSVAGDMEAYIVNGRLEGVGDGSCALPAMAVPANTTTEVAFTLTSCELPAFGEEAFLVLTSAGAADTVIVPIKAAEPAAKIEEAIWRSLTWALVAGVATLGLGAFLAYRGWRRADGHNEGPPLPDGKVRPIQGAKHWWALPALPSRPTEDLDWTGGITGKLVFVGAGVAAVLGAGDLLDPIMTIEEQTLLTAGVITAALMVGVAPIIVAALQVDYVPKVVAGKSEVIVGDRQLVASVTGVVLAAALTAAAVSVEVVALWDAANYIGFGFWSKVPLIILAAGVVVYCSMVAGAITLQGKNPPIIDDPFEEPTVPSAEPLPFASPRGVPLRRLGRRLLP